LDTHGGGWRENVMPSYQMRNTQYHNGISIQKNIRHRQIELVLISQSDQHRKANLRALMMMQSMHGKMIINAY
jgi:hypothetical protein